MATGLLLTGTGAADPLVGGTGDLGARAVHNCAPFADNTTAAAVRWLGA